MSIRQKRQRYYFGFLAEIIASWYLRFKFYKIIDRRFKSPFGEIDLVARKNNQIIFIEVKARRDTSLMDFISKRQQQRITKAAEFFLIRNPRYQRYQISFDVIIMNKFFIPKHFKNYW